MLTFGFVYYLYMYYMSIMGTYYEYLSYSSTKPKLSLYGKNLGVAQGACTLYKHRTMQPDPKSQNIGVLSLNILN